LSVDTSARKVYCNNREVFLFILMIEEVESSALEAEVEPPAPDEG